MKHVKNISRVPDIAQTGICTNIVGNSQATLCFVLELLTGFVLPVLSGGFLKEDTGERGEDAEPIDTVVI